VLRTVKINYDWKLPLGHGNGSDPARERPARAARAARVRPNRRASEVQP
jgi:hypothetical protein